MWSLFGSGIAGQKTINFQPNVFPMPFVLEVDIRGMTKEELWEAVLAQIQFHISPANFATWFKNTGIITRKDNRVLVSVPNNFSKEWLANKYDKTILKILHNFDDSIKEVDYTVAGIKPKAPKEDFLAPVVTEQLEFQEFKVDRETNLNPRYTFEKFIVGGFNELAHAAAVAVSKSLGNTYNPLFIYGGVGLGKTHIIQAIGNEIHKKFPQKKVKYVSSEKFTSAVVTAIQNHNIENLKNHYRETDLLIIDDIQFLAGKEKTQEEFFHTFNALYEKNKQIIISSDRPPKAIHSLEERLRSRFEGGMITDIGIPDLETRLAILEAKIKEMKEELPVELLEYIATNIKRNIREIEGGLNILVAFKRLNNKIPDMETAKTLLKNLIQGPHFVVTPKKIIQAVASFFDLAENELYNISRKKEVVRPRQVAMYLLREDLKSSFPFIGRKFGGKDHTTAIYAHEKISQEIEKNQNFKEEIELIRQRITSG